jgi:hypothetical protein
LIAAHESCLLSAVHYSLLLLRQLCAQKRKLHFALDRISASP